MVGRILAPYAGSLFDARGQRSGMPGNRGKRTTTRRIEEGGRLSLMLFLGYR